MPQVDASVMNLTTASVTRVVADESTAACSRTSKTADTCSYLATCLLNVEPGTIAQAVADMVKRGPVSPAPASVVAYSCVVTALTSV